ncbi:MAG: hypothetical protein R8K47_04150 [Mariprofundaceae bacterium]
MNGERLRQALAVVLLAAMAFVWWWRRDEAPAPMPSVNAVAPRAQHTDTAKASEPAVIPMPKVLLRNPFRSRFQDGMVDWRQLRLSMVSVGRSRADTFVRINGRILREGDEIHGYRILSIHDRGVWVRRAGEDKHFIRIF